MDLPTIIALALGLAMDCFAVSLGVGLAVRRLTFGPVCRLSLSFGVFQFGMLVGGGLGGRAVAAWISGYDHWVAFGLLSAIGARMIWESRGTHGGGGPGRDPTWGLPLLVLSVATSIDALAAGVAISLERVAVWLPGTIIGLVAAGMTVTGMTLGRRVGARLGRLADLLGGLILIAIGIRILLEHLLRR